MRYALDQASKEPITTFYKIVTHLVGLTIRLAIANFSLELLESNSESSSSLLHGLFSL
jgi:hypothetical protein